MKNVGKSFHFMNGSLCGCACIVMLSASVTVRAAPIADGKPKSTKADVDTKAVAELKEIRRLFGIGLNALVIEKATALLATNPELEKDLLYWRGYAKRRIGWFESAQEDLCGLGDFVGWPKWSPASKLSADLKQLLELRPPNQHIIRVDGKTAFRVYYDQETPFATTVVNALPESYSAASKFFGVSVQEIPVFIFEADQYEQFFKFYSTLKGTPPRAWWRVLSHSGTITVSRSDQNHNLLAPDEKRMPQLMAHEMSHRLLSQIIGTVKDLPNWINEGVAESGAAAALTTLHQRNDQRIQTLLKQNAILPLNRLDLSSDFHDAVDEQKAGAAKGDPYAQGFNMVRYLGLRLKGENVGDFLALVQSKASFEGALKERLGLTPDEFYDEWLQAIKNANRG